MYKKFEMRKYLNAFKKNSWLMGIITLLSFLIAIVSNFKVEKDVFRASSTVYGIDMSNYADSEGTKSIIRTYADVITSKKVADRAALIIGDKKLQGEEILKMISYKYSDKSAIYHIYADSSDPNRAITVANGVANAFSIEVNNLANKKDAQILDEAYEYEKVFDGRKQQVDHMLGITFGGAVFSLFLVLLYTIFSNRAITVNDATLGQTLEILGVIPGFDVE